MSVKAERNLLDVLRVLTPHTVVTERNHSVLNTWVLRPPSTDAPQLAAET
jgi:hypothetical protein